jgi:two-component system sensor histidine kinase SenX3
LVDVDVALAGLVGLVGLGTGAVGALALRWSERERAGLEQGPTPQPALPAGVGSVLSVLRSSAVVLDEDDLVVKASPAAHSFGLVRGDRLCAAQLLEMAHQVRADGEIREAELELPPTARGGAPLAVSARLAPLGATMVLVLVEDRTEARRINAMRRDFVANVSHELKTPVGALSLLAEAVSEGSDDPESVRRFAGRMRHEAARLTALVQDLIDLSRLQDDDPVVRARPVAVDEIVSEAIGRSRSHAQAKRIEVVSGGERRLHVLGDAAQLTMALGNLVENAVNYSPEGTRVAIVARDRAELVEISVTDQGIGIPDRERERIFERFYRLDPARSRATGGTGLGLSIVKHVAASHGGEVSVWSVEGAGSTFTLRLPLVATPPLSKAGALATDPEIRGATAGGRPAEPDVKPNSTTPTKEASP